MHGHSPGVCVRHKFKDPVYVSLALSTLLPYRLRRFTTKHKIAGSTPGGRTAQTPMCLDSASESFKEPQAVSMLKTREVMFQNEAVMSSVALALFNTKL